MESESLKAQGMPVSDIETPDSLNFTHYGNVYTNQWDMLEDFMKVLDIWLYYHYIHHQWVGPDSRLQSMMGFAVSRAEFEMNLQMAAGSRAAANLTPEEVQDVISLREYFFSRMNAMPDAANPFLMLIRAIDADEFMTLCLLVALAAAHERKYEKIFIYLQDDVTQKHPLAELAIDILAKPGERSADYYSYFLTTSPLRRFLLADSKDAGILRTPLVLHPRILDYLIANGSSDNLPAFITGQEGIDTHEICVNADISRHIYDVLGSASLTGTQDAGKATVIYVAGAGGSGRRFHIAHALEMSGKRGLFVDMRAVLERDGGIGEKVNGIIRENMLYGGVLCFRHFEELIDGDASVLSEFVHELSRSTGYLGGVIFLISEKAWNDPGLPACLLKVDVKIPAASGEQQLKLWEYFSGGLLLSEDIAFRELTTKFNFTPLQIKNSMRKAEGLRVAYGMAAITADILYPSCYEQVKVNLDTLASHIQPAYSWEDLVLPGDQIRLLREACDHVRYKYKVYNEWGYDKKIGYGRGLSMLFSGPPGTGKTMAGQIVAGHLHMELYKIQLSAIVSKYIGETEKNLRNVFREAKDSGCILFFDETDALFGKRSEVKDSHDRHANIETAFLLQQLEEYDGVIIMGTNLLQNIDIAFMRRINFVVHFPFPEAPVREQLWRKMITPSAPVSDDIDFTFLAERFTIAGGNIRNIVLHAAFMAAADDEPISMRHLLRSTVSEMRKTNTIVSKEDLREYADIVF